jgi:hypothetical protein
VCCFADPANVLQALVDWEVCFAIESQPSSGQHKATLVSNSTPPSAAPTNTDITTACTATASSAPSLSTIPIPRTKTKPKASSWSRSTASDRVRTVTRKYIFPSLREPCDAFSMPALVGDKAAPDSIHNRHRAAKLTPITKHYFNRLQASLHDILHPSYHLFSNGMILVLNPNVAINAAGTDDATITMVVHDASSSTLWLIARGSRCTEMLDWLIDVKIKPSCNVTATVSLPMLLAPLHVTMFDHDQAIHLKNQVCVQVQQLIQ